MKENNSSTDYTHYKIINKYELLATAKKHKKITISLNNESRKKVMAFCVITINNVMRFYVIYVKIH